MDPIVVVSMIDDAYLPFAAVVARSIAANAASGRPIEYHVFHAGSDTAGAAKLAAFAPGDVRIIVHTIDNPLDRFGTVGTLPPSTLLRLLLPELLPDERAIYLDTDLIVLGDLADLAAADLRGKVLAGVTGMGSVLAARRNDPHIFPPTGCTAREHLERYLGFAPSQYRDCINAGVLVMDLPGLRAVDFSSRTIAFLEDNNSRMPFGDQDAVNVVLRGEIALLDPAWNVENVVFGIPNLDGAEPEDIEILRRQLAAPKCLHYAGLQKPWRQGRMLPLADLWWHFASNTPFRSELEKMHRSALAKRRRRPHPLRPLLAMTAGLRLKRAEARTLRHPLVDRWRA